MSAMRDILYLEDDDDMRAVVTEFLRDEGFDVTSVSAAADALAALERERFRLLLSDYHLPDNNAGWLLREADARALLQDTQVIVLTSERAPRGVDGHLLLKKPVESTLLLTEIARRMQPPAAAAPAPVTPMTPVRAEPPPSAVVQLSLYVSSSLDSLKAVRNLRRILQAFDRDRVSLAIHDVTAGSAACLADIEEDRVVVTPTLVRRAPRAKVWVLGDLSKRDVVEEMIREGLRP
jgi:CheY-like chemotaxis protein